MRPFALIFVFLLLGLVAIAQEQPADCTTAVAFAAFDEHWAPLNDLRADQLTVRVGHKQQAIRSLQRASRKARIIFILDGSGSMGESPTAPYHPSRWLVALQAAMDVVSTAPEGTFFGVVTFGGPGEKQFDLTTDKRKTLEFLVSLKDSVGKGRTPLFDAITRGLKMLQPGAPGDAVFLFTDGGDNTSRTDSSQLSRGLGDSQAVVLGILFKDTLYRTPEETEAPGLFGSFVERTGGEIYTLSDDTLRADGVVKAIKRLRSLLPVWDALLYHPYLVDVHAADRSEHVSIALTHSDKRLKSARLAYPHKLPACAVTQPVASGK